jgi:glycosyltransferase involved in cell wall biosynthesis
MEPVPFPPVPGITGLVLTRDGQRLLDKCLASLFFCDTLLVVDSGSTDRTLDIAESYNAEIFIRAWEGFDRQFTFAQQKLRSRWFFILDQDEICPRALGEKIAAAVVEADSLADTPADTPVAFSVNRRSWYFDRFLRHSGWYPDPILRVFRTGFVEFFQDAHIHYRPLGSHRHISGAEIIHYPYTGFEHQLDKLNAYARQGADYLKAQGRKGGVLRGLAHGCARFFCIYFLRRGFLDGRAGFLAAAHGAFYAFLKYVRVLDASWGAPFDQE